MAPGNNHVSATTSEIFKYVRIHPNFASQPVLCEKMFLCCFSLKAQRKDMTNRHESPSVPPNDVKRILAVFCCVAQSPYLVYQNSALFQEGGAIGAGEGGGGVGQNFRPVCQVFSPCF